MNTPNMTATAHLIAKVLAHRATTQEEVGDLIRTVHGALERLNETPAQEASATEPAPRRRRLPSEPPSPAAEDASLPPPAPKLVRRAELSAAPLARARPAAVAGGTVRGIVKWFDPKSGKGALRLPGLGDIPLDPRIVADSGITRLFKGQEIEALLAGDKDAPQLQRLTLPGVAAATPPLGGGIVQSRRAKPVVVEMKREGLRRVAARAEAEQLLGRSR